MLDNSPVVSLGISQKRLLLFEGAAAGWQPMLCCLLVVGLFAVYLLFPTREYYWDGITFSRLVEASDRLNPGLIHPHHLLYNVFGFSLYRLAALVGWHPRAVNLLSVTNSCLSVVCVVVFFRFLAKTLNSVYLSVLLCGAFAFSAVWWKYSIDADAYVPSVLLLTCSLVILFQRQTKPFRLGLIHSAAMCMHQLAVFLYPALVAGILLDQSYSRRQRLTFICQYTFAAVFATLSLNYLCFHWQTGAVGIADFARWLTSYLHGQQAYSFSFDFFKNLTLTLNGEVKLLFGGRITYLSGLTSKPIIALIVMLLGLMGMIVWRAGRTILTKKFYSSLKIRVKPEHHRLATVCCVWIATYVVFLFFWYPYFTPYRVFYLSPLICLAGILLASVESSRLWPQTLACCVAAMFLSNFLFSVYPQAHVAKNRPLQLALDLNRVWTPETHVLYAGTNADNQLVQYFNSSSNWIGVDQANFLIDLNAKVDGLYREHDSNVWLDLTAVNELQASSDGRDWLAGHTSNTCQVELLAPGYHLKFVRVFPETFAGNHIGGCY